MGFIKKLIQGRILCHTVNGVFYRAEVVFNWWNIVVESGFHNGKDFLLILTDYKSIGKCPHPCKNCQYTSIGNNQIQKCAFVFFHYIHHPSVRIVCFHIINYKEFLKKRQVNKYDKQKTIFENKTNIVQKLHNMFLFQELYASLRRYLLTVNVRLE